MLHSRLSPLQLRNPAHLLGSRIPAPFQSVLPMLSFFSLTLSFLHSGYWKFCTPVNLFKFLHSVHNIEFDPTPFPQHPHDYFPVFIFCVLLLPVAIILVFSMLTLSPLNSSSFLHLTNLTNNCVL